MKTPKLIKGFDALAFKEKAQAELHKITKGMTTQEQIDYLHQRALSGPLARLYAKKKPRSASAVRERKAPYKAR